MLKRFTGFALLSISFFTFGCGGPVEENNLSPATNYREGQIDHALEGVTVVGGLIVPEAAPPLSGEAMTRLLDEVESLLDQGRRPDAIATAVAAVRGGRNDARAYRALGRAMLTTRRIAVASAAFATAVRVDPEDARARYLHGVALDRQGSRAEAVSQWREALDLDPGHGDAHARLAAVEWLSGDVDAARSHLSSAVRLGSPVPEQLRAMIEDGGISSASAVDGHRAGEDDGSRGAALVGPQIRLNPTIGSVRANETSAAGGPTVEVVAGWNDYSPGGTVRTGVSVSLDGGTFSDQVVRAPAGHLSDVEGDPMTAVDPRTGTLWVGAISFDSDGGVFVARKQPGTTVFEPSVLTLASGVADKGWLAAGPQPGQPDTTRLYVAYNLGLQSSDDLGDSWSAPVGLGSGVGFLPRVGPDGAIFISYWNYGSGHFLRRSFDGGQTVMPAVRITTLMDSWDIFESPQIPGDFRVPQLPSIAVDPVDGTLFCVYFDTSEVVGGNADVDLWLTRSDDDGATWSIPVVINTDPSPPGDQFFPWLEIDSESRLHLLYYDTSLTVQDDTAPDAWIDAFYAISEDRGASWTTHRLTTSSFDSAMTDLGNGQFIGDYLGMAVSDDRAWPVYLSTEHATAGIYSHEIVIADPIFMDGFESGDTLEWSSASR